MLTKAEPEAAISVPAHHRENSLQLNNGIRAEAKPSKPTLGECSVPASRTVIESSGSYIADSCVMGKSQRVQMRQIQVLSNSRFRVKRANAW